MDLAGSVSRMSVIQHQECRLPDCLTGPLPQSPSVAGLLIADAGDFVGRHVNSLMLTLGGLQGDRHEGETRKACARTPWHSRGTRIANTRQISLVSVEDCREIAELLGIEMVDPALLGPNLVLTGVAALSLMPPATRLQFPSGATLFITEQNVPRPASGRAYRGRAWQSASCDSLRPRGDGPARAAGAGRARGTCACRRLRPNDQHPYGTAASATRDGMILSR